MEIQTLICNHLCEPLGVETPFPKLSWTLASGSGTGAQTAYQVLAASHPDILARAQGDLWDSGKVVSDQSLHVAYAGASLLSRQVVFWKVRVWDESDRASAWSAVGHFEMGLLQESDWKAQWVASPAGGTDLGLAVAAPYLRKSLLLTQPVTEARLYWSGLGFCEVSINGQKVGDAALAPGFTRYDQSVLYQTADITAHLRLGENVFGALLGNGWYNGFAQDAWDFRQAAWRDQPKLLLQAHISLADGTSLVLGTGCDWKAADSPIRFDGLRNGEWYDACHERPGWDCPGYDDREWTPVRVARPPGGRMRSEQMPPMRVTQILHPIAVVRTARGSWIVDVGQNIAGFARIRVREPRATTVTLRYAESLDEQGELDTKAIAELVTSGEFQTDRYVAKGEGEEVWAPRFVYHGFRYVEIDGLSHAPTSDSVQACVMHTDLPVRGEFTCSSDLLNRIQQAARWSTLTNYHSIPTDCPHREKNGWTGDASLSSEQVLLNFDPVAAYRKWMQDFLDIQRPSGQLPGIVPTGGWGFNWGSGPAWDSALFLIPWHVYLYTGDSDLLRTMLPAMERYLQFALTMMCDGIADFGLGDWCPPTGGPSGHACPTAVTDTAWVYVMARVLAKACERCMEPASASRYHGIADTIRRAFRTRFVDGETGRVEGDCQTATATALYQGLLEPSEVPRFLDTLLRQLKDRGEHLDTGILGAKYVMHTLAEHDLGEVGYRVASQTTFPSWGHWIAQGATTLWEMWDGGGSHNHHMFSDISAWFYQALAGIWPDEDDPGFHHIRFRPQVVAGLHYVRAHHDALYGRVSCEWRKRGDTLVLHVTVPVNCRATLFWPGAYGKDIRPLPHPDAAAHWQEAELPSEAGTATVFRLRSGAYGFTGERM